MPSEAFRLRVHGLLSLGYMLLCALRGPEFWLRRRLGFQAAVEREVARMTASWSRKALRAIGAELQVEGAEHIPPSGAVVVMSNHQSQYDIPVLMAALGRPTGFLAKRELFRIPGLSFWMRQLRCLPLNRQDTASTWPELQRFGQTLQALGHGFIIFPEGTRSRDPDGTVGAFKRGSLRLAAAFELPVLPVAVDGTRHFDHAEALEATRGGGRVVRVRIEPPRHPRPDMSGPERKAFMDALRETIVSNREAIRVEWHQP